MTTHGHRSVLYGDHSVQFFSWTVQGRLVSESKQPCLQWLHITDAACKVELTLNGHGLRLVVRSVMHTVGRKAGVNDCYSYVCGIAYQPEMVKSIAQLMSS